MAQVSTTLRLQGHPAVLVTAAATAAASTGLDTSKSPTKRALVKQVTVNGQEVDILIRIEQSNGRLFFDLIADKTIADLSVRVAALDLTATAVGHPSPKKDKVDLAALVAAGGS